MCSYESEYEISPKLPGKISNIQKSEQQGFELFSLSYIIIGSIDEYLRFDRIC